MAVITATVIFITAFLLYLIFRFYAGQILADFFLLSIFVFYAVFNPQVGIFYLVIALIAIVFDLAVKAISTEPAQSAFGFKGFGLIAMQIGVGIALYALITAISVAKGGNIVGAPTLQVTTSQIGQNMRPTIVSLLGIIENRYAIIGFNLLMLFGLAIPILNILIQAIPALIPAGIMGFVMASYHVIAYSVAFSLLIWAMLAFMLFLLVYFIMKDSLSSDVAHIFNNFFIDIARPLALVI